MWNKEWEESMMDGWMDSERKDSHSSDGGEDPLLTGTLIINMQRSRKRGQTGRRWSHNNTLHAVAHQVHDRHHGQEELFLPWDKERSCFSLNYLSLHAIKIQPSYFFSSTASNLTSTHVCFTHSPFPSHSFLSICRCFNDSCSAFLHPPLPPSSSIRDNDA